MKTLYKRENRERIKIKFRMTVPSHGGGESGEEDWRELHGNIRYSLGPTFLSSGFMDVFPLLEAIIVSK